MKTKPPFLVSDSPLSPLLTRAAEGPEFPERWFVLDSQTFAQVYGTAAAIRLFLKESVPEGSTVCLCSQDRGLLAAALLATLDGRTPLVLSHSNTDRAIEELHRLTRFAAAITDRERALPRGVTVFSALPETLSTTASPWSSLPVAPHKTWLKLYTGGSTGTPKIWSKTAANLWLEAIYLCRTYGIGPADRLVATVVPNHIYGLLYSVMAPLMGSATVVAGLPTFPREIVDAVEDRRATVLISVPAHYRALNPHPPFGQSLRLAFSSAGALSPEDGDAFFRQTGTPVTEIYGSTETGGIARRCRRRRNEVFTPLAPIDWNIEDNRLRVRSDFISHQLPTDDRGYFITPDKVQVCGDGFLIKGRADNVVKVGGKRVDLDRVREALTSRDAIRDAYVAALPLASGRENELVAVVESDMAPEDIRKMIARFLEPFERPRRIRTVRQIPTTPAGKYDRKSVAALFSGKAI